jgi:hypothetical protein
MKRKYIHVDEIIGLHSLPDRLRGHEILWDWDPGHEPVTAKELQDMWNAWRAKKAEIDADWLRDAEQQLAAAKASIDEDKRKTLIQEEFERREQFYQDDAKHTEAIVANLFAAMDEAWKRTALKKANKVGDQIRKSDAAAAKRNVREQLERLGKPTRNTIRLNLELPI